MGELCACLCAFGCEWECRWAVSISSLPPFLSAICRESERDFQKANKGKYWWERERNQPKRICWHRRWDEGEKEERNKTGRQRQREERQREREQKNGMENSVEQTYSATVKPWHPACDPKASSWHTRLSTHCNDSRWQIMVFVGRIMGETEFGSKKCHSDQQFLWTNKLNGRIFQFLETVSR